MSIVFITHDLGVVAEFASQVVVMYAGRVVESGPVDKLFSDPLHPYTRGLLASVPPMDVSAGRQPTATPADDRRPGSGSGRASARLSLRRSLRAPRGKAPGLRALHRDRAGSRRFRLTGGRARCYYAGAAS